LPASALDDPLATPASALASRLQAEMPIASAAAIPTCSALTINLFMLKSPSFRGVAGTPCACLSPAGPLNLRHTESDLDISPLIHGR
jgi:hypothetical protein